MQRAGAEGTPVFLVGGKPEVPAQTESVLRQRWQVNIVGSRDGYFTPEQRRIVRTHSRQRGENRHRRDGVAAPEIFMRDCRRLYPHALYMGVGGTYDVLPGTSIGRRSSGRIWGWSGSIACFCSRAVSKDSSVCCAIYVGIIPVSSDIPLQPCEFAYIFCVISSLA